MDENQFNVGKENDITIVSQNTASIKLQQNKLLSPRKMNSTINLQSPPPASNSSSHQNFEEFKTLERNFADALLKNRALKNDITRLEHELKLKASQFDSHNDKLQFYEQAIKGMQEENLQKQQLLLNEIETYKEIILKLENEINQLNKQVELQSDDNQDKELLIQYEKLIRDYRILENQFELEKNQKLVYLDQVEFLSRKNEKLILETKNVSANNDSTLSSDHDFINELTHQTNHTMNQLTDDEEDIDNITDGSFSQGLNINLVDHSSPIKDTSNSSIRPHSNFQFPVASSNFPPSPDPESRDLKRQSLPTQLKRLSLVDNSSQSEFVLSPFKLTPGSSSFAQEDDAAFGNTSIVKRYSSTKPNHSRYNSHDIIPIKVEFEEPNDTKRSISGPEKRNSQQQSIIEESISEDLKDEYRNGTLFALNGYDELDFSKNFSCETGSSSKRSSMLVEDKTTREEITKLKFELQSLRLHNEKLLSYIGFELQKQKKNIKKLSKKQSSMSLKPQIKKIEYSDAKLIASSKDVLINKKRVLRSVSINTILDKANNINSVGLLNRNLKTEPTYLVYDGDDESLTATPQVPDDKMIKKFASQVFHKQSINSDYDETIDSDFENWNNDEKKEDLLECSSASSSEEEVGVFNQIKHLVIGKSNEKKNKHKRKTEELVDDGLKFKFFTIALGIIIISFRLTPQANKS